MCQTMVVSSSLWSRTDSSDIPAILVAADNNRKSLKWWKIDVVPLGSEKAHASPTAPCICFQRVTFLFYFHFCLCNLYQALCRHPSGKRSHFFFFILLYFSLGNSFCFVGSIYFQRHRWKKSTLISTRSISHRILATVVSSGSLKPQPLLYIYI